MSGDEQGHAGEARLTLWQRFVRWAGWYRYQR